jgi:hypothetical protein
MISHPRPTRPKEEAVKQIKPIPIAPIMCAIAEAHAKAHANVLHYTATRVTLRATALHRDAVEKV